jgi:hypothetical protein
MTQVVPFHELHACLFCLFLQTHTFLIAYTGPGDEEPSVKAQLTRNHRQRAIRDLANPEFTSSSFMGLAIDDRDTERIVQALRCGVVFLFYRLQIRCSSVAFGA